MLKKVLKSVAILALIALVVIQFIRPEKNLSGYDSLATFETELGVSPELHDIMVANCYDCHSNQSTYPWYAEVAPFSFWIDDHIEDGKKHFNPANWADWSLKKKDHKLEELIEEVQEGEMPLDSYTWLHGSLSEEDKTLLIDWAKSAREKVNL